MKKHFGFLILFMSVLMVASISSANLITSGDFTGVILQYPSAGFSVTGGVYNTWQALGPTGNQTTQNGNWKVDSTGGFSGVGDSWARHYTESGGIWQGIAGQGTGTFNISLNYIYEPVTVGANNASLYILGLNSGQSFSKFNFNPPDAALAVIFSQQLVPPTTTGWETLSLPFTVAADYDAWLFLVYAPAWTGAYPAPGLRGIDNVGLTGSSAAPVPEPATMLLLGAGLVGLAGFRRRFKK